MIQFYIWGVTFVAKYMTLYCERYNENGTFEKPLFTQFVRNFDHG